MKKKSPFQLRLNLPFIIAIIVMSSLTIYSMIYTQESTLHKTKESIPEQFTKFLDNQVDHEASEISEYIDFMQSRDDIAKLFVAGEKQALYGAVKGIYEELNENVELTHMYFIRPDGKVLLRVHDHERDLDTVERMTFLKAKESQSLFYGLEFGLKQNYTLRVVRPWMVDGRLIGYLELGKEIDKFINEYAALLDTHVYLAVEKEHYRDAPGFVKERLEKGIMTSRHHIVYQTFGVPEQMEAILAGSIFQEDITFDGHEYYVTKDVLTDVSGHELGHFVFLNDITLEHEMIYGSVKVFTVILLIVAAFLSALGFIVIKRKEQDINTLTSRLNAQKDKLEFFNIKLQKLFDLQKNIVVLTDGEKIKMANQALYDFLGFEDLEEFLTHYQCICDRFIENDSFFHLGKVPEGENWIKTIQGLSGEKRIVAMIDDELSTHVFSVAVNEFEESHYVIAFSDISNTMLEQVRLMRKVTHDKLTGALNREFFEKNITQIIKDVRPQKLGMIFADIDHFKQVNDVYGHNRGDEVLKQFVKTIERSIRHEDYLIRWGGEEFIILMRVNSVETLEKAIESVRLEIEKDHFEEVENITSSFGATLYQKGEQISDSIERADKALYQAKESGRNRVRII